MKACVTIALLLISAHAMAAEPVLLWNTEGDRASFDRMRDALEAGGGHAQHAYPPHFLAGRIAAEHLMDLPATAEVLTVDGDRSILAGASQDAQSFAEAWTRAMQKQRQPRVIPENVPPLVDDVISITTPGQGSPGGYEERGIPYGADATDTSSYMIGDVSVGVVLPESNESVCIDLPDCTQYGPDQEDWTDGEILDVEAKIVLALDWWAARSPDAHLTFMYDFKERLPTSYEPIWGPGTGSNAGRCFWINEVLESIGYDPQGLDCTPLVYGYINDLRQEHGSDWAFAIFVVDSSEDEDGMFSDGSCAFAVMNLYGGGPYQVMTYDNGGYGIGNMDTVCAHESGHMFGALDQYACDCDWQSGYLYFENQNCANSCLLNDESIMGNGNIVTAFANGAVDYYARGQIGWQDTDGDGIHDIQDTHPLLTMSVPPTQTDFEFQLYGSAVVNPMDAVNPYYNSSSINTISAVQYRLNGEAWQVGSADDGTFDGPEEAFTLNVSVAANGEYTIECRAENSVGNYTDPLFVGQFDVDSATGTPAAPMAFRLYPAVPNPANPTTTIRYQLPHDAQVSMMICDLSGRTVKHLVQGTFTHAGSYDAVWDGTNDRGASVPSGIYLCQLIAGEYTEARKVTLLK